MAQHDGVIANAAGPTVRADINTLAEALLTNNSGTGAPSPTWPHMWWPDTTTGRWKRRNAANTAWIDCGPIDEALLKAVAADVIAGTETTKAVVSSTLAAIWKKGTDIASASPAVPADGGFFHVTGTTAITGWTGRTNGPPFWIEADGAVPLTHNATSLALLGGANIVMAPGDMARWACNGGDNFRMTAYHKKDGSALTGGLPRSYLAGFGIANNGTDPTNDIDIAVGCARDSTNALDIILAGALTKRLDAAWTVGSAQGGLDTGSIANGTYHVHAIKRPDTGVVDVLFSASATAPTLPTDYTVFRRIASFLRVSGAIVAFTQIGDEFLRKASILDITASNPGASAVTRTLSVPSGLRVWANINVQLNNLGTGVVGAALISALDANDEAPATVTPAAPLGSTGPANSASGNAARVATNMLVRTNTSAQVRSRLEASDGSCVLYIATLGWIDNRGRDDQ